MDDGELDLPNQELFSSPNMNEMPTSCSMDGFFEELLKDSHACTHTHTCNPPGPDSSHTHTCFHVHTKIVSTPSDEKAADDDTAESTDKKCKKRPMGNRDAIEGEIGSFPYQKPINNMNLANPNLPEDAHVMNPCNMQCDDQVYCEDATLNGQGFSSCEFENLNCMTTQNILTKELPGCGLGNVMKNGSSSGANQRKDTFTRSGHLHSKEISQVTHIFDFKFSSQRIL
ncbi:hypothetical protein K2173_012420 [Erythroxylum novogranatense]|uniref:Uncharacterized protein n=1 Tax=Erythroxylum novogranatense TaxID=1862640 RepID=A0AAV8TJA2_9ROSI|nr:hypothetical protein K2173_012420 [Erythroxylum novogranatense]